MKTTEKLRWILEYIDLCKGEIANIPVELLNMDIKSIGAKNKGILDIKIEFSHRSRG